MVRKMTVEKLLDKLADPLIPPSEKEKIKAQLLQKLKKVKASDDKKRQEEIEAALEILAMAKEKGCVYPQEIQVELEIGKVKVLRLLRKLEKNGYIQRLKLVEGGEIPIEIKRRLNELWDRGIRGIGMFKLMKFYKLTDKGKEALEKEEVVL